jgi:hypothetical protein
LSFRAYRGILLNPPDTAVYQNPTTVPSATGTFDVKITPLANDTVAEGSPLGRMSLEKQFHGDLDATSKGEMLTAGTAIKNSAGYVAIERVSGTLHGKRGTFALQHNATMTRGEGKLAIIVVPDSGTGELTGLSGTLGIEITGGKHFYTFEYAITP